MGKNSANKARPSLKGSGSLPDYFNPSETRSSTGRDAEDEGKMAPGADTDPPLSRQDLLDLGADLKSHFASMIAQKLSPIAQQLSDLASALKEVSSTAENAMELGLTLQEDTKSLQRAEQQLFSRVAVLESQARSSNLKFRGLPESADLNSNLPSRLATWLASALDLEGGVAPTILSAYRLGPLSAARPGFPRDVIAQFLYPRSRNAVLQVSRSKGPLRFEEQAIQVLLDLPPETLAKRRLMKPITECLHRSKVRFRWSPTSDILVYKEGRQLRAEDISTGKDLLSALSIPLPADLPAD